MSSFLQQAVDKYRQLAGPEFQHLEKVSTPFHDDKIARPVDTEAECKGKLAPIASRVLMKLLFAARMARFDLLRAVQGLASTVTKWSIDCDKALHRLVCCVNVPQQAAKCALEHSVPNQVAQPAHYFVGSSDLFVPLGALDVTCTLQLLRITLYMQAELHYICISKPPLTLHRDRFVLLRALSNEELLEVFGQP